MSGSPLSPASWRRDTFVLPLSLEQRRDGARAQRALPERWGDRRGKHVVCLKGSAFSETASSARDPVAMPSCARLKWRRRGCPGGSDSTRRGV